MNEHELLSEALKRTDPAERAAFLDQTCAGDSELRHRLVELLCTARTATPRAPVRPRPPGDPDHAPQHRRGVLRHRQGPRGDRPVRASQGRPDRQTRSRPPRNPGHAQSPRRGVLEDKPTRKIRASVRGRAQAAIGQTRPTTLQYAVDGGQPRGQLHRYRPAQGGDPASRRSPSSRETLPHDPLGGRPVDRCLRDGG